MDKQLRQEIKQIEREHKINVERLQRAYSFDARVLQYERDKLITNARKNWAKRKVEKRKKMGFWRALFT